jgi:hypothetical protein
LPIALDFVPVATGQSQEIHLAGAVPKPVVMRRVEPFAPASKELGGFAGEYTSPELEVTYTIAARDSGLAMRIPGRPEIVVQPVTSVGYLLRAYR